MKNFRNIARILVGLVFIFSGFVKGIDPMGTVFRIQDYFQVFGMPWALQYAPFLSIFLCTLEFTLGIVLLFNVLIKQSAWILFLMMLYFTVLTFFDAVYNLVPDCGCFGDVVKLTNLQTFLKNLVLMALVVVILVSGKKFKPWAPVKGQAGLVLVFAALFAFMTVHAYYHLPVIDVLPWKKGSQINKQELLPIKFYVTYKNKKTGEEKEYLMPNYPWNDSVWMADWAFKSQRTEDPNKGTLALRIEDESGADVTSSVIGNKGVSFLVVSYDILKPANKHFKDIIDFTDEAINSNIPVFGLTNSLPEDVKKFNARLQPQFDFYYADDVVLKMMIRSNPGVIMIRNGVVVNKWSFRDLPAFKEVTGK